MMTIKQRAVQRHIESYYPNARIVSYRDAESGLKFYTGEELAMLEEDWFPLACELDPKSGEVRYGGRAGVVHTYVEGYTGAGKTTRYVMQCIRALSCTKQRPSFLIVDIHGEILPNIYGHLVDRGYQVKVLNCHDAKRSHTYNPLLAMAREAEQGQELRYDNVSRIASVLQPETKSNDPIWDQGARAYFTGIVADKLEDVQSGELPLSCMTLYNVVENHFWLRDQTEARHNSLNSIPHYERKGAAAYSVQKMTGVLHSPDRTRASYMSVGESKLELVAQPLLYQLSSSSDIDVAECVERPCAIVVQSANHMVGDSLVSLLVNDIYDEMDRRFKAHGFDPDSRRMHCFLDEFANCRIATEDTFIRMLTTSRKMGMFWHLLVQSDAQLQSRFSQTGGETIRSNTTEIFMGSMDYHTQERFAKACGQTTVQALSSHVPGNMPAFCVVDVMSVDRLNLVTPGTVFVRSEGRPIMQSYYEAFYRCPDFSRPCDKGEIYPYNSALDYKSTRFTPDDLPVYASEAEYRVLHALSKGPATATELAYRVFDPEIEEVIKTMLHQKRLIRRGADDLIEYAVTPLQLEVLFARQRQGKAAELAELEEKRRKPFDFRGNPFARPAAAKDQPAPEPPTEPEEEGSGILSDAQACALREHLVKHRDAIQYEVLDTLTALPGALVDIYKTFRENPQTPYHSAKASGVAAENLLKFEVIEAYITKNDFSTKQEWDQAIGAELEVISRAKLFPSSILLVMKKACRELQQELTLGNIREIKRIIQG